MLMTFTFDILDIFAGIIYSIDLYSVLVLSILFGGFIHFSSGKIAKEILDVTAKTVGIIAGSTIIYKNTVSSSTDDTDKDKDKKDKNEGKKTDKSKDETTTTS